MKKVLTGLLGLMLCSLSGNAQQRIAETRGTSKDMPGIHHFETMDKRTSIVSDWYNYGNMVYNVGGSVSYFRNFMFPDSTVQVEFTGGMGYVWKHSIGEVFDPSSAQFDFNGQVSVPETTPYTLDSIAIPYRYWRYQTAAPDTLVIQVYTSSINLVESPGWSSGASYANVEYDTATRTGKNETLLIKHLLTSADTSTLTQGVLNIPVNLNIPAGQKVAVTATYFPGNTYHVSDTIDTYTSFTVTNRINAFVLYDYRDNDMVYDPGYYNNELTATMEVRYNTSSTGWNGEYIPGTAWFSGIYYGDMYFKITFDADYAGIHENVQRGNLVVYPNPTNDVLYLNGTSRIVKARVQDLNGQTVVSENGTNLSVIHTNHLAPAVYVLCLTDDSGKTIRQRFVKQ